MESLVRKQGFSHAVMTDFYWNLRGGSERVMRVILTLSEDEMRILPLDLVACNMYDGVVFVKQ